MIFHNCYQCVFFWGGAVTWCPYNAIFVFRGQWAFLKIGSFQDVSNRTYKTEACKNSSQYYFFPGAQERALKYRNQVVQLDIIITNNNKIIITASEELSAGYRHAANLKVKCKKCYKQKAAYFLSPCEWRWFTACFVA